MYHEIIATILQICIHDVIDDVNRSQNRSNFKLIYLRQYLSYSVDQKLKMSEMLMAIFLVYSTSGITSGKNDLQSSKWWPFWKILNIKHSFILASDMKRSSQIMQKKVFLWRWRHRWRHRVASKFLSIFMFRRGWLRGQIARAMFRQ